MGLFMELLVLVGIKDQYLDLEQCWQNTFGRAIHCHIISYGGIQACTEEEGLEVSGSTETFRLGKRLSNMSVMVVFIL